MYVSSDARPSIRVDGEIQILDGEPVLTSHDVVSLLLTVVFDPLTPLVFLGSALLVGRALGRLPLATMLRALWPFWLLSASLLVSNALFASRPEQATILWRGGPFIATVEGALIGLSLAERGIAVAAFTIVLIMSTDPTALVRSLVQQAHLPPRFAYPALAAYRFLPLLQALRPPPAMLKSLCIGLQPPMQPATMSNVL